MLLMFITMITSFHILLTNSMYVFIKLRVKV